MLKKIYRGKTFQRMRALLFPYKMLPDEFYDALYVSMNGATLFVPENIYCVNHAIKNLPTHDPVLEIGSFTGMSTCMLSHFLFLHNRDNRLINIDKWEFEEKEKQYYTRVLKVPPLEMKQYIRDSFLRNVRHFTGGRLPHTFEMLSDEFFEYWRQGRTADNVWGIQENLGGPISFAYLDGNHQYTFVKRDFENVHGCLVQGGYVFFDDSAADIDSGMHDFMKEMKARKDYEVVMKNPNYLFRRIR